MSVRPPAVAGLFYPAKAEVLAGQVDELLSGVDQPAQAPKAVIVPHAGYVYSGSTAALGYSALWKIANRIEHVVILGPTHRVGVHALALPEDDTMVTPLGQIPVWPQGAEQVMRFDTVVESRQVHAQEHSLEVQLPFLQRVLPSGFDVLPLAVGWVEPEQVAAVLHSVWGGPETLIVISSDLSHYHTYDEARKLDSRTLDMILHLDQPLDHDQACGATPVNALLLVARALKLRPVLFGSCNSGDTAGDPERVVGYAAVGFYEPEDRK
jgi:AmmeMemoRadiSam system protein B